MQSTDKQRAIVISPSLHFAGYSDSSFRTSNLASDVKPALVTSLELPEATISAVFRVKPRRIQSKWMFTVVCFGLKYLSLLLNDLTTQGFAAEMKSMSVVVDVVEKGNHTRTQLTMTNKAPNMALKHHVQID